MLLNCLQAITIFCHPLDQRNGRLVRGVAEDVVPLASTFAWKLVNTPNCEIMRGEVSIFEEAQAAVIFSSGSLNGCLRKRQRLRRSGAGRASENSTVANS